mmetsp:Transcript_40230/g.89311  ORF Transcript_40230/g.89311 Transcript_40230/m.89311 type:complete len:268 (-) Transcript_40230:412-1215(-)
MHGTCTEVCVPLSCLIPSLRSSLGTPDSSPKVFLSWPYPPVPPPHRPAPHAMRASTKVADLIGPAGVFMSLPFQVAVQSAAVPRLGCTASHNFFLSTTFGVAGAACSFMSPNQMRSPGCAPCGGTRGSTTTWGASLAASSMPKDLMPLMLRGLRLQSTTTMRFCICSRGTYLTRPDTMVRGSASPTSIFSTYKLSASGCLSQLTILPTRMSSACRASMSALPASAAALMSPAAAVGAAAGAAAVAGAAADPDAASPFEPVPTLGTLT